MKTALHATEKKDTRNLALTIHRMTQQNTPTIDKIIRESL